MVPRPTLQKELKKEEKDLGDDIVALTKKVILLDCNLVPLADVIIVKVSGEGIQQRPGPTPRYRAFCYLSIPLHLTNSRYSSKVFPDHNALSLCCTVSNRSSFSYT